MVPFAMELGAQLPPLSRRTSGVEGPGCKVDLTPEIIREIGPFAQSSKVD